MYNNNDMDTMKTEKSTPIVPFSANVEKEDHLVVFIMHGDLDVNGAQTLRNVFINNIEDKDAFIVLDMSDVPYINSAGLGVFVAFHKHIQIRDGQLMLLHPQENVKRVIKITSLNLHILSIDSMEDARRIATGETPTDEQSAD